MSAGARSLRPRLAAWRSRLLRVHSRLTRAHQEPVAHRAAAILFEELQAQDARAAEAWASFHAHLSEAYEGFSAAMGRHLRDESLLHLLALLLIPVARNAFRDAETRSRFFDIAQAMGIHILPVHYSSPVPNTAGLPESG